MTALTQKASGRVAAILMVTALAATLMLIALRPARAETPVPIPNTNDVCSLLTGFTGEEFSFQIPSGGDPDRVFTETYTLEPGVTLSVVVQTNRKEMTFQIQGAKVMGVGVFDKTNLRSGYFYNYGAGTSSGTVTTPGERNIKAVKVCYQTKADPTLTSVGWPGGEGSNSEDATAMKNTATLSGGVNPTGTITWTAYSDDKCETAVGGDSITVDSGNGEYTTPTGVLEDAGEYYWIASYDGDENNNSASSGCGAATTIYLNTIACGTDYFAEVTGGSGDVASRVEATRSEIAGKDTCSSYPNIPYELSITDEVVSLDYPTTGIYADGARFLVKIEWNGDADSNDPPNREVKYLLNGTFVPGVECLFSTQPNDVFPSIDFTYEHPANAPVCKAGEYLVGTSTSGLWQQVQWWDTIFDPQWK